MKDTKDLGADHRPRLKRLLCRRTNEQVDVAEHERCPYCFGVEQQIVEGRHEAFCDYKKERDPVHFGFPVDGERERHG